MKQFIIALAALALLATSCLNNSHPSSAGAACPEFAIDGCQPTPAQADIIKKKVSAAVRRVAKSDGYRLNSISKWSFQDLNWVSRSNGFETFAYCTAYASTGGSHDFCYRVLLDRSQRRVLGCIRRRDIEDYRKAQADSIRKAEAQEFYDAVFGNLDTLQDEGTQLVNLLSK